MKNWVTGSWLPDVITLNSSREKTYQLLLTNNLDLSNPSYSEWNSRIRGNQDGIFKFTFSHFSKLFQKNYLSYFHYIPIYKNY